MDRVRYWVRPSARANTARARARTKCRAWVQAMVRLC
jgi:hypothetical protein